MEHDRSIRISMTIDEGRCDMNDCCDIDCEILPDGTCAPGCR